MVVDSPAYTLVRSGLLLSYLLLTALQLARENELLRATLDQASRPGDVSHLTMNESALRAKITAETQTYAWGAKVILVHQTRYFACPLVCKPWNATFARCRPATKC